MTELKVAAAIQPNDAVFPEMREFWTALDKGQLLVKACGACGKKHFYPRPHCPFCGSNDTRWAPSSGKGHVYSFSVVRKNLPLVATTVVELEDALRLVSVVVEADVESMTIGQEITLFLQSKNGRTEIAFTTEAAQTARAYAERATRQAATPAGLSSGGDHSIAAAAVIGGGTMGVGIAVAFANAGTPVVLVDRDDASLQRAMEQVRGLYQATMKRGKLSSEEAAACMSRISTSTDISDISEADVTVEAVWEQLQLKQGIFEQIDRHAKPGALLGTNTSGLDINEIATRTKRPFDVVGLHFFSPAHVMKLLEVVRCRETSEISIERAFALARLLRKAPVLVESSPGFSGNRILRRREVECRSMLHEGALPEQIDLVLKQFGMSMGPYETTDMAGGVELHYRKAQENGDRYWLNDEMFRLGRLGQKAGQGYYRYDPGSRTPRPDPVMASLLEEASRRAGFTRRRITDEEVRERVIMAMINEAARVVEEVVVQRPSDVDAVWLNGYGWPKWRGGILYYADQIGIEKVHDRLLALQARHGARFAPSELLERLALTGGCFLDLPEKLERAAAFT